MHAPFDLSLSFRINILQQCSSKKSILSFCVTPNGKAFLYHSHKRSIQFCWVDILYTEPAKFCLFNNGTVIVIVYIIRRPSLSFVPFWLSCSRWQSEWWSSTFPVPRSLAAIWRQRFAATNKYHFLFTPDWVGTKWFKKKKKLTMGYFFRIGRLYE